MILTTRPLAPIACAVSLILAIAGPAPADEDKQQSADRSVTLDAQAVARMGIATTTATAVQYRPEAAGFGQVMTIDSIAQTDADLTAAEAANQASRAALERAQGLFRADSSVSRQALETAEHQASDAATQLALAQRKSTAQWGYRPPWHDAATRSAVAAKVAAGDAAIVRATFPAAAVGDAVPTTMRVERLDPGQESNGWTGSTVWSAPADPAVPGRSFFVLIEGGPKLSPGEHVRALLPVGPTKQGVLAPTGAVIVAQGGTWLYVEDKPNRFVRREIDLSAPTSVGYFVADGIKPGEAIVTEGAGLLLAREIGPPPSETGTDD